MYTAFRDLWLSWVNEKLDKKNTAQKMEDEFKQQRVNRLVSLIADLQRDRPKTKVWPNEEKKESNSPVIENWDDDSETKVNILPSMEPTQEGMKLQREFTHRQATDSYKKMKNTRDNLPMASYREQILDTVRENAVTILAAETGAGKTTQCKNINLDLFDTHLLVDAADFFLEICRPSIPTGKCIVVGSRGSDSNHMHTT